MTQPPPPRIPTHGAVDLSALKARPAPATAGAAATSGSALGVTEEHRPAGAAGGAHGFVVEVTEANFASAVMSASMQVPIVLDFWAGWCEPCKQLGPILEALAAEYDGRFVLATIDTDANPQLAQAVGVQSLPTVMAVVGQQPVPLFTGALPEAQVRQYIDELLRVAAANGIVGRAAPQGGAGGAAADAVPAEPVPGPHDEAGDALDRGDLDGAEAVYAAALERRPNDPDGAQGLALVALLRRVRSADPARSAQAAAADPADVAAACQAADLEMAEGKPDAAFARLVAAVRATSGAERDAAREHLLGLFTVAGPADPAVIAARRALASALF